MGQREKDGEPAARFFQSKDTSVRSMPQQETESAISEDFLACEKAHLCELRESFCCCSAMSHPPARKSVWFHSQKCMLGFLLQTYNLTTPPPPRDFLLRPRFGPCPRWIAPSPKKPDYRPAQSSESYSIPSLYDRIPSLSDVLAIAYENELKSSLENPSFTEYKISRLFP